MTDTDRMDGFGGSARPTSVPWMIPFFGAAGLVLAVGTVLAYMYAATSLIVVYAVVLDLTLLGAVGAWLLVDRSADLTDLDLSRVEFLIGAGLVGLFTVSLGIGLPFTDAFRSTFADAAKWRENWRPILGCAAAILAGTSLIVFGLSLARDLEKRRPNLRRLLYGYNAVAGSVLTVLIVILFNMLMAVRPARADFFNHTYVWTESQVSKVSPESRKFLESINQPVKIDAMMPSSDRLMSNVETLLENCRSINPKITWEALSRDVNRDAIADLKKKYPFDEAWGLLILYGTDKPEYQFIPGDNLWTSSRANDTDKTPRLVFQGETQLVTALTYLVEGKSRPVVYFTQSEDELQLNDMARNRPDVGLGVLKEEISKENFEIRDLNIDPVAPKIPDDANIIVVAGPRRPFSKEAVAALRAYMLGTGRKAKGKMVVLLDVVGDSQRGWLKTGLEDLLAEYNVRVGNERVLALKDNAAEYLVITNPKATTALAKLFLQQEMRIPFLFDSARPIEPAPVNPGAPSKYVVEELVQAYPLNYPFFKETDLSLNPTELAESIVSTRKLDRISQKPISVGVTVVESAGSMPQVPGHEGLDKEEPRMVVFGDASWISNNLLSRRAGAANYSLFANAVVWLRERPNLGVKTMSRDLPVYRFNVLPDVKWELLFLPVFRMFLAVVALGGSVWVLRRR